jgi:hypothetical protein
MNKLRIIAVSTPVDGKQKDGSAYSYIKVTAQRATNAVEFTATPPITRNFFRDNKFDASIFVALLAYITKFGATMNDPANLATLPNISGERRSEELPNGLCYYVLDDKGKPRVYASGADKGKQMIANVFTTMVIEDGESYETLRKAYINRLYTTGAVVKYTDLAGYEDPKARQMYADMLTELKRVESLESSALPE